MTFSTANMRGKGHRSYIATAEVLLPRIELDLSAKAVISLLVEELLVFNLGATRAQ